MTDLIKTDKKLPEKADFFFAFIQMGESFGEAMVEGFTWTEQGKWYFRPLKEEAVYQVERNALTFAMACQDSYIKPLTH